MDNKPAETVSHDVDILFRLGVVAAMGDRQLLEKFVSEPETERQLAFEAIVRRHGPMVLGVCRRVLRDYHDAEDAFQATFLVLALKAGSVRKQHSLGPWLHSVAARIAHRARLVSVRRKQKPMPTGGMVDRREREPSVADLETVLDEELNRLPEKYRLPVVLCYLQGRTQEDVAKELGWTKGTVSGRLARAKTLLQHRLVRRGLAPSAGLLVALLAPASASAAVHGPLLNSTVRAATLASFGGATTGLVAVEVMRLARQALKVMLVARISRAAALFVLLGAGATAIAAQVLGFARPARQGKPGARAAVAAESRKPVSPIRRLDRFGDPLPAQVQARLGTIERRHTARIVGVAFSPRDQSAVTAQMDGLVRFWDPVTGRANRIIDVTGRGPGNAASIRQFAIDPDGRYLAAVGFDRPPGATRPVNNLWIWSLSEDKPLHAIDVKSIDLQCLALHPDGTTIATGAHDGKVMLWDVATGDCKKTVTMAAHQMVFSLSFSRDGKLLATIERGKGIELWESARDESTLIAIPRISGPAPYFSGDGRYMAVSTDDRETIIWDRQTNREHLAVPGSAAGFAPDSRSLAVIGSDVGTLAMIDTENGQEISTANLGSASLYVGPAFSPDGKTIIAGLSNVLRFFDTDTGMERFVSEGAHSGLVSAVRYAPDGNSLVTAGDDGTIRQWDARTARQLAVLTDHGSSHRLARSPDGDMIAATAIRSPSPAVRVWDIKTGQVVQECLRAIEFNGTEALAFSSDGKELLFYSNKYGLRTIAVATGQERAVVQPQFSPKAEDSSELALAPGAFSPANRYLAICTGTTTHVVELASGAERFSSPGYVMTFAPDDRRLAIATDGRTESGQGGDAETTALVELADISSGARKKILVPTDRVNALAFSPDGNVLAVGLGWYGTELRLYSTDDGRELDKIACPARRATYPGALTFAPDGRSLAAGLDDTTVVIWNVRNLR